MNHLQVVSAVVCPMTPLLLRHLAGLADPLAGLREAAVAAVREALADADAVLVLAPVGGREAPARWRDPSRPVDPGSAPGPLASSVASHVLRLAGCGLPVTHAVVPGELPAVEGRVALLVMGDGAAARGQGAPGHVDERSFPYDDELAALLAAGDGAGLTRLDDELGAGLLATGRLSLPVLGELVPSAEGQLRWREDPFGVTYLVALWRV